VIRHAFDKPSNDRVVELLHPSDFLCRRDDSLCRLLKQIVLPQFILVFHKNDDYIAFGLVPFFFFVFFCIGLVWRHHYLISTYLLL